MSTVQSQPIAEAYRSALEGLLSGEGESALSRAYAIGRDAVGAGVSLLEIIEIHDRVLSELNRAGRVNGSASSSWRFLTECLAPFEMVRRSVLEANAALHRINDTVENELRRVAHALHDEAGQILVSLHLALDRLARECPTALGERVRNLRGLLDEVEAQMRRLSHELRPTVLDHLGLLPALRFLAEGVSARSGIRVDIEGRIDQRLPASIETPLYRVAQEALHNVLRHSRARRARVRVSLDDRRLRCSISDDGRGFVPETVKDSGLGLIGIRERLRPLGGSLQIHTTPGKGTELLILIPLEGPHPWPFES
jgi:signal transduction histidine kinase